MGTSLTVVVPIYNVEAYLAECLDSLAGQTYPDLEVVLVDDGSTDDSGSIAAGYAARDPRFRLIRKTNAGLGAARNTGIDAGTGEYLAFVDSDDVLAPYAFEVLVGALERTGSDFASGNVALLTRRGLRQSPLHRGTHRVTRLGVRLTDQQNLVYDRLACNKVFRRSFWDRYGLRFPEGVRYEDIPVTIPAYALASTVDVIDLPVYYWRQREAGAEQSISQRQSELPNLVDRFAAVDSASRSLAGPAGANARLKNWYDETALRSDLRMFLDLLPETSAEYQARFLDLAGDFLSRVDPRVLDRLPARLRVAWGLARERALPELLTVLAAGVGQPTDPPPVVRRGLRRYVDLPLLDAGHPGAPRRAYALPDGIRTEVHEVWWSGERLHIRGLAHHAGRGATRPWDSVRLFWLRERTRAGRRVAPRRIAGRPVPWPGQQRMLPLPVRGAAAAGVGGPSGSYRRAAFAVSLDARRLRGRAGWQDGEWSLDVAVFGPGRPRTRTVTIGDPRPALPARWVADGVRAVPFVRSGALWLRVHRPRAWVTGVRLVEDAFLIEGVCREGSAGIGPDAVLWLARVPGVPSLSYPVRAAADGPAGSADGVGWSARVPLADLVTASGLRTPAGGSSVSGWRPVLVGEAGAGWRVALADSTGEPLELPVLTGFTGLRHTVDGVELLARPADDEVLWLRAVPPGPVVRTAEFVPGADPALELTGELPDRGDGWAGLRLALRWRESVAPSTGRPVEPPADVDVPVEVTGASWRARVPLAGAAAPPDGDWLPLYRRESDGPAMDLLFDASARRALPRDVRGAGRRAELLPDRDRELLRLTRSARSPV